MKKVRMIFLLIGGVLVEIAEEFIKFMIDKEE